MCWRIGGQRVYHMLEHSYHVSVYARRRNIFLGTCGKFTQDRCGDDEYLYLD